MPSFYLMNLISLMIDLLTCCIRWDNIMNAVKRIKVIKKIVVIVSFVDIHHAFRTLFMSSFVASPSRLLLILNEKTGLCR